MSTTSSYLIKGFLLVFMLQACGGIPDKDQLLEQARLTYAKAESMPSAAQQKYTLAEARIALQQAEESQNKRDIQEFARIAIEKSEQAMSQNDKRILSQRQTTKLSPKLPAPSVQMESYPINNGIVFVLPSQPLFDENQKNLEALAEIQQIAQELQKNPRQQALIEGHTNNRGNRDFNDGLSYRQANAIRFALMRQGIASNRIIVKGLGSSKPLKNDSSNNQRIQVIISNTAGLAAK